MFMSMGIAQVIHIEGRNMSLRHILDELKKQSGYSVFIRKDVLDNASSINLQKKNRTVEELLEEVTRGQQLDYQIKGKEIVLSKKATAPQAGQKTSRSTVELDVQQETVVRGVLVDTEGKPVAKATVRSKNTGTKVESDASGQFQIKVSLPDELLVSYVGFTPKKVAVTDTRALRVALEPVSIAVEDVVVTGLFSRPTENFTGSAVTLKGEDLRKVGVTDLFKNVAALDPAFNIVPNNIMGGNINNMPEIQIRGQNSFPTLGDEITTNPNQPLFILDGFEVSLERIKDLDINIINSVVILKDASATTIYGSRGANGVMVINTLEPEPGKLRVSVTNDLSISTPDLSVYRLLDARQKLDFERRVGIYTDEDPNKQYALDQLYNHRLKDVTGGINTDWRSLAVQTGINNRTTVALSGGDDAIRYGINATTNVQNGVMKGQDRINYQGQFDFSYRLNKFRFSNSARFYQTKSNESPYGAFSTYLNMNPYWAPYDADGNLRYSLEDFKAEGAWIHETRVTNPLFNATLNTLDRNKLIGFQDNLNVRYDVHPSLFVETKLSVTKELESSDLFLPGTHTKYDKVTDPALKGEYKKGQTERFNYEFATYLNYNKRIGKSLLLGTFSFELGSRQSDGYNFTAVGFPTDNLDHILYATQYKPNSRPGGAEGTANRVGMLLNGNYSYDNRYLADLSVRRDGSSAYGTDRKFGNFWSVGMGWNLHNEAFFKDNENVDRMKLRASYGSTGSLEIPAYASLTQYVYDVNNTYDGNLGIGISGIGNPNLGWQEKRQLNVGADVELFKTRLGLRVEYYNSTTNQAITQLTLAPSVGFDSYHENYGKINNKGAELAIQYKVINRVDQGFIWTLFVNGMYNKNTLLKISDNLRALNKQLNGKSDTIPNFLFEEGRSTTSIFAVHSLGVNPANGKEVYLKKDGSKTYTWSAADKIAYGDTQPDVQGTFGTNVYYKGFELGVILDYRFGGQIYNQTLVDRVENVNPYYNVDERAYNLGWAKPGDVTQFRQIHIANNTQTFTTTRFVEDDNTVNLNSFSFGYLFRDQPFVKSIGFNSLRVKAIINDMARFSTVKIERGRDNPFARTYSLSINASF
jgi:TonB-linked SusC/RagA family outer membrane protein